MTTDILKKNIFKKDRSSDTVNVPELLSPAGDPECARAAIICGADAIYLGLKEGSARAGAGNFTFEELGETCRLARSMGVKVYVALNTLAFGEIELDRFAENAQKAASEGADGVIVQDTGLLALLSEMRLKGQLPRFFRIHASTQAGFANSGGISTAMFLGADRVILPRELTLDEISSINASAGIELEVFVHGAMCMSFSGNCLLSSYIGGRSGNRGSCAQPCRMKYRFDETGLKAAEQKESKNSFSNILSPDDLCALPFLDEVCRTGVSSIKIEGRLKSPEYTALVTRIYREALDAISENRFSDFKKRELEDAMRCLRTMFTRSGGGPGYLKGNSGRAHMTAFGPGRSGAVIGTGDRIRRISGITAAGNNNTLEFFEFRLTPFPAGSKSGRASISLSPGDGVTLISSSGLASGGTVNRVTEDGIMTVCGTIDPAFLNKDQVATVFQTADAALNREIQNVLSSGKPNVKLPAKFSFYAEAGHPAVLTAEEVNSGIRAASKTDTNVTEALTRPLSKDEIKAQLLKLGDTCFHAAEINIDVRGSIFMTVSAINALRRQVTAELAKKLESGDSDKSELPETTLPASRKYQTIKKDYTGLLQRGAGIVNSRYYYRLSDFMSEDEDVLAGSKIVYLPWETWESRGFERRLDAEKAEKAIKKAKKAGILAVASLPLLPFRADTAQFQKTLKYISETADGIMLANTGDFGVLEKAGIDLSRMLICADISLNSTNPRTVEELSRMGADIIALSPEYPDVAIAGKVPENVMIELVSGPLPLMRMRHCVIGHGAVGCSRCERRDRKFRICDTAGSKYDIITLPDMDNTGSVSGGSENGRRFCENIILSAGVFEPKASMQGDSPLLILSSALIQGRRFYSSTAAQAGLRTLPNNLILRTQVWNGDDNDERNN